MQTKVTGIKYSEFDHVRKRAEDSYNQTDVFAVHGADPEILAYAMAKYSRSALSCASRSPRSARSAPNSS